VLPFGILAFDSCKVPQGRRNGTAINRLVRCGQYGWSFAVQLRSTGGVAKTIPIFADFKMLLTKASNAAGFHY
jgi:hypothetical protein